MAVKRVAKYICLVYIFSENALGSAPAERRRQCALPVICENARHGLCSGGQAGGERNREQQQKQPVLWIRNDLFWIRIQLRIFGVPDPDPTHII